MHFRQPWPGYLDQPQRWSGYDPELFDAIRAPLAHGARRHVALIEHAGVLPGVEYFADTVPEAGDTRGRWLRALQARAERCELLFLDPDNGLEVRSTPFGRRGSSKFVYWHEVSALWERRCSLLIFQHFTRERRARFIPRMLAALGDAAAGARVEAYCTARVLFLLALQPEHQALHDAISTEVRTSWRGQIEHWESAAADR